jgi:hypothetical protein
LRALVDAGVLELVKRGQDHRLKLPGVVGLLGDVGRHDDLAGGRDRLGVVALNAALPERTILRESASVVLIERLLSPSGSGANGLRPPSLRPCSASHSARRRRFAS